MSLFEVTGLNSYYRESHILFDVSLRVEALDRYSDARRGCAFRTGALSFIAFYQIDPGRMNQRSQSRRVLTGGSHSTTPKAMAVVRSQA